MAKSYSYVKKLYFGCTIFRATARSTNGYGSWSDEKSYSPTLIRICDVSKLQLLYTVIYYFYIFKIESHRLLTRLHNGQLLLSSFHLIMLHHIDECWKIQRTTSFAQTPTIDNKMYLFILKNTGRRQIILVKYGYFKYYEVLCINKMFGRYCLPAKANYQTQSFSRQQCGLRALGAKEPNHKLRNTKSY